MLSDPERLTGGDVAHRGGCMVQYVQSQQGNSDAHQPDMPDPVRHARLRRLTSGVFEPNEGRSDGVSRVFREL